LSMIGVKKLKTLEQRTLKDVNRHLCSIVKGDKRSLNREKERSKRETDRHFYITRSQSKITFGSKVTRLSTRTIENRRHRKKIFLEVGKLFTVATVRKPRTHTYTHT
jgi:hypothetical protein